MRNTQKTLHNSNEVRQLLPTCWGEPHVLYLLRNGWMPRILQDIVTSLAIGSSKILTDSRAERIFGMQRINLSKPAHYIENNIVKRGTAIGGKPNISAAERKMIRTLLCYSVGYNVSDKMLGPVIFSRNLYLKHRLRLSDRTVTGLSFSALSVERCCAQS